MIAVHVTAGLLSLATGAIALYSFKGGNLHRKAGTIFAWAMLVMTSTGAVMAALQPARLSVIGGVLTFYLVTTSLLTVRRRAGQPFHWIERVASVVAFFVALGAYASGFEASASPNGQLHGFPAVGYFVFGSIALLAGALDIRMLRAGVEGRHRIARHLWRMGMALWIATGSFFLGQAKVFPEAVRKGPLLAIPVLLVAITVLYWLVKTLRRRHSHRPASDNSIPQPTGAP
jgi:uncharacterized membrane protein